jgi:flavodoxin
MKIGLIIHSRTGHTWSVAEAVGQALRKQGHDVTCERIVAADDAAAKPEQVTFTSCPDIRRYDALVFGAPVRGFNINPVIQAYLGQLPSMGAKPAACFVTMHLKKPWMGGNRALSRMRGLCRDKGLEVLGQAIVSWSSPQREQQIDSCVESIETLFASQEEA